MATRRETRLPTLVQQMKRPSTEILVNRVLGAIGAYDALGVHPSISSTELRKVYRKTCTWLHPDKCDHPRATEAFQKLHGFIRELSELSEVGADSMSWRTRCGRGRESPSVDWVEGDSCGSWGGDESTDEEGNVPEPLQAARLIAQRKAASMAPQQAPVQAPAQAPALVAPLPAASAGVFYCSSTCYTVCGCGAQAPSAACDPVQPEPPFKRVRVADGSCHDAGYASAAASVYPTGGGCPAPCQQVPYHQAPCHPPPCPQPPCHPPPCHQGFACSGYAAPVGGCLPTVATATSTGGFPPSQSMVIPNGAAQPVIVPPCPPSTPDLVAQPPMMCAAAPMQPMQPMMMAPQMGLAPPAIMPVGGAANGAPQMSMDMTFMMMQTAGATQASMVMGAANSAAQPVAALSPQVPGPTPMAPCMLAPAYFHQQAVTQVQVPMQVPVQPI